MTLASLIHAQCGATESRMLNAANDPCPSLKLTGEYHGGTSQSAAVSRFVTGLSPSTM